MELWDAYNEDETLAGVDLIRGNPIPKGYRHAVAEIMVIHEDGDILVMQRDLNKATYPGYYEASAGGAVLKGESFYDGALRELEEETGIKAKELTQIYSAMSDDSIYKGYVCKTNIKKDDITLQEGETIAYKWLSKEQFLEVYNSKNYIKSLKNRQKEYVEREICLQ